MALTYKCEVFDDEALFSSKKGKVWKLHTSHILFKNKPYSKNGIWIAGRYVDKPKNVSKEDFETARNQLKLYLKNYKKEYHRKRYQANKDEIKLTYNKNKPDRKVYDREHYLKNKEKHIKYVKNYQEKHKEEIKEKRKIYRTTDKYKESVAKYNKARSKKYYREYYLKNKETMKENSMKWISENKEHRKKYYREYYLKNKEKLTEYKKDYHLKKIFLKGIKDTDPQLSEV